MRILRSFPPVIIALLSACVSAGTELPASGAAVGVGPGAKTQIAQGLSFVEAQCSGCHAVRPGVMPPNPQAPSFVAVANEMGFNQATLHEFFRDGHDTPAAMSIKLEEGQADMAAAYIMSLRSPR
jgi:mono/diheme cytochrome c family protein